MKIKVAWIGKTKEPAIGALVILPHNLGTWREAVAVDASRLVSAPPEIDPVDAVSFTQKFEIPTLTTAPVQESREPG